MDVLIMPSNSFGYPRAKKSPQEGVAPTVERWTPNPTVAGSNPVALIF